MGFSVSGAAAIIFASLLVGFGVWFTAASNGLDRVTDAQTDRTEGTLTAENTAVMIDRAVYNESGDERLVVNATNDGTVGLALAETDLLVDGRLFADWQVNATVAGGTNTDLWLPGEELVIDLPASAIGPGTPETVKLVTATGVADTAEVTASG